MSLNSPPSAPTPPADPSSSVHRGGFVAIYALTAVIFAGALLGEPGLLSGGRWIPFTIGIAIFGVLADRTARIECQSGLCALLLTSQGVIALALMPLSDLYTLTPMLTFITVSLSQQNLPRRWANLFVAALIGAIALVYGFAESWIAAVQAGAGYAAGYVFVIAFTRIAQREQAGRQQLEILYRDLERANQQLAEYAAQVEQIATMRERNRLARDVHDSLGHYLTVLNVQLEIVNKLMEADPARAREAAARAKELASEGLAEVRRSVAALRPSSLDDHPLSEAIRRLADDTRAVGLVVSFTQTGATCPLSPEIETVLYRTAQEALTNIRRHAHASAVQVLLAFEPEAVRLRVHDNGVGRSPQDTQSDLGLQGLHERVSMLKGSVRAENHPDGGFLVEVRLPYGGESHE